MHDLIIIGAGPAGLTAALYAARYRLNFIVLEKMMVGGQILLSPTIENFPAFPGSVSTEELIGKMKMQVEELGVKIDFAEVTNIFLEAGKNPVVYSVRTQDGVFQTKSVILATGAHWKRLGIPGEEKSIGKGVSYCGTCDGPLFKNKEIVVVGGGDRAIEEAIFLTKYASRVNVVHRRHQLRSTEILQEQAKNNPKINFILDSVVEEILGQNRVESVRIKNLKTQQTDQLNCQGVFVFIGIAPSTEFLKGSVEMDESGFIITNDILQTSQKGIFACGDCREKSLYQVVISCGEGAVAAHSAHTYLLKGRGH